MNQTSGSSTLFIGNMAADVILDPSVDVNIDGSKITLTDEQKTLEIIVDEPDIQAGLKLQAVSDNLGDILSFPYEFLFGGGGYNSVRSIHTPQNLEFQYLDTSSPRVHYGPIQQDAAQSVTIAGATPVFLGKRPIPLNIVLGDRTDKIIIKSGVEQVSFTDAEQREISDYCAQASAIAFSSVKDQYFAESAVQQADRKVVAANVTTSLDPDFVMEHVLPSVVFQSNADELDYLLTNGERSQIPHEGQDLVNYISREIQSLRSENPPSYTRNMYVTIGRDGVVCSDTDGVYHVRLKDPTLQAIDAVVSKKLASTNGAGDAFFGKVAISEYRNSHQKHVTGIAMDATRNAVEHIGYMTPIPARSFEITKLN
tara:strand:+ start:40407 stop:41513 length:1107 start_codon:yes stop_codon:yes gene_type:complete